MRGQARHPRRATGNVNSELKSLNAAVIDRYGTDECRSFLSTLTDPSAAVTVKAVTGPSTYDYTRGGLTTTMSQHLLHGRDRCLARPTDRSSHPYCRGQERVG
jgi:hypothetical protein